MRSPRSFVLDTLRNVQGFVDDNAQIVGPSIAASRRSLDDVVQQLTLHAVDQGGGEAQGRAGFSQGRGEEEGLAPGMNGRPGPPAARLEEIAGAVGGTVVGAPDTMITGVSSLAEAAPGDIAYVERRPSSSPRRSTGSESHRSSSPNPASPSSGSSRPSSPPPVGRAASPAR